MSHFNGPAFSPFLERRCLKNEMRFRLIEHLFAVYIGTYVGTPIAVTRYRLWLRREERELYEMAEYSRGRPELVYLGTGYWVRVDEGEDAWKSEEKCEERRAKSEEVREVRRVEERGCDAWFGR
jgi:hypothetical protein